MSSTLALKEKVEEEESTLAKLKNAIFGRRRKRVNYDAWFRLRRAQDMHPGKTPSCTVAQNICHAAALISMGYICVANTKKRYMYLLP